MHPPEPTMNIAPDPPALAKTLNRLADALAVVEDTRTVKQLRQAAALLERMATGADNAQVQSNTLRSEEHTSELQSLMRTSYAVFCLQKKKTNTNCYYIT